MPVRSVFEWDEWRFALALLDASLWCYPPTGAGALDSTDILTWGRVRYRTPVVDADPTRLRHPAIRWHRRTWHTRMPAAVVITCRTPRPASTAVTGPGPGG